MNIWWLYPFKNLRFYVRIVLETWEKPLRTLHFQKRGLGIGLINLPNDTPDSCQLLATVSCGVT